LPVVSRCLTAVTDRIVDNDRTGFLFDTPLGYQEAVKTLIADAGRRRMMGQAARAVARERFDLRVIARRYADLYRSLTAGRRMERRA
jgi:glycosyltransferase involved in cell wall biosynthesis